MKTKNIGIFDIFKEMHLPESGEIPTGNTEEEDDGELGIMIVVCMPLSFCRDSLGKIV